MACPGGCIGGGGQPKTHDPQAVLKRMGAIYQVGRSASGGGKHAGARFRGLT